MSWWGVVLGLLSRDAGCHERVEEFVQTEAELPKKPRSQGKKPWEVEHASQKGGALELTSVWCKLITHSPMIP